MSFNISLRMNQILETNKDKDSYKFAKTVLIFASSVTAVLAFWCYWYLSKENPIVQIFLSFSILNTISFIAYLYHKKLTIVYLITSILVFVASFLITFFSGGILSSFIVYIPLAVIAGYVMKQSYGNFWLIISILSLVTLYFVNESYIDQINCIPPEFTTAFGVISISTGLIVLGGVYGRYFSSVIYRSINKSKKIEIQNKEKEVLLKEIHHRVKNNLQVITGLLCLQAGTTESKKEKELLQHSQLRINSMAIIHQLLYQSERFDKINYDDYLCQLISELTQIFENENHNISTGINSDCVFLNMNTAIPLGLMINEIITNSFRHGIVKGGDIYIELERNKNFNTSYLLKIGDNGIGIDPNIDIDNLNSLGLKLINNLVVQIDGSIKMDTAKKGTHYLISFNDVE